RDQQHLSRLSWLIHARNVQIEFRNFAESPRQISIQISLVCPRAIPMAANGPTLAKGMASAAVRPTPNVRQRLSAQESSRRKTMITERAPLLNPAAGGGARRTRPDTRPSSLAGLEARAACRSRLHRCFRPRPI